MPSKPNRPCVHIGEHGRLYNRICFLVLTSAILLLASACNVDVRVPSPTFTVQSTPVLLGYSKVTLGHRHGCAIRLDQTIVCWGDDSAGQASPPNGQYTDLAAGKFHTCAITDTSAIVCWGSDYSSFEIIAHADIIPTPVYIGQTRPPAGQFKFIAADEYHTCATYFDDKLTCWGTLGVSVHSDGKSETDPWPKLLTDPIYQFSIGGPQTCGITTMNRLVCWGGNSEYHPTMQVKQVALGEYESCALDINDHIQCWSPYHQPNTDLSQPPDGKFKSISLGDFFGCGIRLDSTLTCWPLTEHLTNPLYASTNVGQLDHPTGNFSDVSATWSTACAIKTTGAIECWGDNSFGQASPP